MLELTPTAAEVVTAIVSQQELPEPAGMRITSEEGAPTSDGSDPSRDIRLSVVEGPQGDDKEVDGAPVYVESGTTAELLDDKLLDARVEGEEVQFRILAQAA
jgi:iron-sulfur cluster assembly protein